MSPQQHEEEKYSMFTKLDRSRKRARAGCLLAVTTVVALAVGSASGIAATPPHSKTRSLSASSAAAAAAKRVATEQLPASVNLQVTSVKGVKAQRGKTVLVVPVISVPFTPNLAALKVALSAAGLKMRVCDGQGVPSTIASCMAQATSTHPAAVITLAVPYQLVSTSYDSLAAEKIPTLAAFQDSDGKASSRYLHFALQAPTLDESVTNSDDYIIDRTKGKGHVLILGNSDSPTVIALTAKTASYLKAHCPACTISTKSTTTAQASQIPGIVSSFVLANPDTNYILAVNLDVDEPGILSGLQSAHRTNIPFGGGGSASGPLVKSGTAAFASLNSASYLAWEWTDATLRVIAGQPAVKYPVVERLFDPANVAHINFSASRAATFDWFGKSNYESAFKLAWGLS
jgi:ribose transport system substrate-binding protein